MDQRPDAFRRLKLRRIGRELDQVEALGDPEQLGAVPSRPVPDHDDALVRSRADLPGEVLQYSRHRLHADRSADAPLGASALGMNKSIHIAPLVASSGAGQGTSTARRPDPTWNGNQPDPGLVLSPNLNRNPWMTQRYFLDLGFEPPFLKASWATGSACG